MSRKSAPTYVTAGTIFHTEPNRRVRAAGRISSGRYQVAPPKAATIEEILDDARAYIEGYVDAGGETSGSTVSLGFLVSQEAFSLSLTLPSERTRFFAEREINIEVCFYASAG